jgi:hypothetical protein
MKIEFKKVSRNGRNTNFVSVSGPETVSISDVAQQLCVESSAVIRDINRLPDNERLLVYVWTNDAKPYIRSVESDAEKSQSFRMMFLSFRDGDSSYDEAKDGAIKNPSDYLSRELTRYPYGVSLAINLGARYADWKLDLGKGPLILTLELDQSQWRKCRISNSVAAREPEKVARYKKAVQDLAPYLNQMEHLLERYEEGARHWGEDKNSGLESLALLNLIERMTDIYSRQDRRAETINALAKEMMTHCGNLVQRALLDVVRPTLKEMASLYFNKGLAKALFAYLKVWDPSDHYYFHTVVANSVDAPTKKKGKSNSFDDRLFQALDDLTRYLSADGTTAEAVAKELNQTSAKLAPLVTELADKGRLGSNDPLQKLLAMAEKFLADIQHSDDTGFLSVLLTWNGYVGSWLGTMEGPPTVAGMIVLRFGQSSRFVRVLEEDTLLRSTLLIGVDKTAHKMIGQLIRRGGEDDLKTARDLYMKTAWRSRTIFIGFSLLGLAALVYHVADLHKKLASDGDQEKFDRELLKLVLYVTSDVGNLGLIYLSLKYSRDLKAFLASNMKASANELTSRLASMESKDWRVATVGVFYKGVTCIGVILSVWDFGANWSKSDTMEKAILFGTVAASLGMFLGALGLTSWLGPAGVVVGVVLGLITVVYQYFKTGFENAIRSLIDAFQGNQMYKGNRYYPIRSKQVYIILTEVKTLEDLCDDLSQAILRFHWKDPDLGYAIEYFRAGIVDESLAKIYDRDVDEIKKVVNDEFYALEKFQERTASTQIELLSPEFGTKLVVGALSPVRVAVHNGDNVGYAFLEAEPQWYGGEPDRYLADDIAAPDAAASASTYDVERKSVMLNVEPERTKYVSVFKGNVRIQEMPPGKVAKFSIKAPKATTKWNNGKPDGCKAQLVVEFPVTG